MGSPEKEYWVLVEETNILGVFETLQECLLWRPERTLQNTRVERVRKFQDGSFRIQVIPIADFEKFE